MARTPATQNPDVLLHEDRKRTAARHLRRALKSAAFAGLQTAGFRDRYPFAERLTDYIQDVAQHPKAHNLYEQLAVLTFVRKLERYEWVPEMVHRFVRFYEILPFDGTQGVAKYKMTKVQVFIVANLFGLYTRNSAGERIRLHRDCYLFVPRKFAKTTLAAAIAVWFMLFEDYNSQAFTIANSFAQARICFDMQRSIMQYLDPEQKMFKVNRETITFTNKAERNARASKSVCLSANPKNLDGLFAELVIRDEGAQARDTATKSGSDLKNVLTSSEGPRKQPLNIDISTASEVVDGPFHREINGVREVLLTSIEKVKGKVTSNDTLFGLLFMPDIGDTEDDPKTWAKVQPHMGITVQQDYYEQEWQRAQLSADNMLTFRTKLLNLFVVNESTPWLGSALAKRLHVRWDPLTGEGLPMEPDIVTCAVDLSLKGDFSAVTFLAHFQQLRQTWTHTRYFMCDGIRTGLMRDPETGEVTHSEAAPFDGKIHSDHPRRAHYQRLVDDGYLTLTHGETIDHCQIADYVLEVIEAGHLQVESIGYDQYRATKFLNHLVENGALGIENYLFPIGQTLGAFTAATMGYGQAAFTGHIMVDANPLTDEAYGGAYLEMSKDETCGKPMKIDPSPTGKRIDGLITNIMAYDLLINRGHKQRDNDIVKQ